MNKRNLKKIADEITQLPKVTKEMISFFNMRTNKHIELVQKYCKLISKTDKRYLPLLKLSKKHDASKFLLPEYFPYLYITWDYKCKDEGKKFEIPQFFRDKMTEATNHHVKNNPHHPEFWCDDVDVINREDRDKPNKLIDCTKMPLLYIAEMLADWLAMSIEKKTNPKDWADKNVNVRWKFNDKQKKLIYDLISKIWKKNELKIGVIGYSATKFDKEKASKLLKKAYNIIDSLYKNEKKIIVSGLTDLGIPGLAYKEAVLRKWSTIGVACSKANENKCFPVDEQIIVGNKWGDESDTFLKLIDVLIKIGGGKQSIEEVKKFKETEKLIIDYDLRELK